MQKLNASFAYGGPALTMQTIENNYRIKVDKYLAVDFNTFAQLINAVGGIDVTLDEALCNEFYTGIGREYSPGEQNLTGVAALYYTRIRNVGNDYGRAERQREVVGQLVKKMALLGPIKLNEVLSEVMPQMWTNLSALEMTGLVFTSFPCVLFEQQSQQIPAENTYNERDGRCRRGARAGFDAERPDPARLPVRQRLAGRLIAHNPFRSFHTAAGKASERCFAGRFPFVPKG